MILDIDTRKEIIRILKEQNRLELIADLEDFLDADYEDDYVCVDDSETDDDTVPEEYAVHTDSEGFKRLM
mgnify:CR=1 FL=1|tara:strand:- start:6148 stop:6357 length:210 start_codon:yes stop_codon:yes gene_type:complete